MGKLEEQIKYYEDGIAPFLAELKTLVTQSKTLSETEKADALLEMFQYEHITLGALKTAGSLENMYEILEKRTALLEDRQKDIVVKAYKALKKENIIQGVYPIFEELMGRH